jgi:hypothetical protein
VLSVHRALLVPSVLLRSGVESSQRQIIRLVTLGGLSRRDHRDMTRMGSLVEGGCEELSAPMGRVRSWNLQGDRLIGQWGLSSDFSF